MARRKQTSKGGGSWFLYVLLIGLGMAFSPGASTILALGLMPTLVAMFVTTGPSASARIMTIGTFNLAGVLPFALKVGFGETGSSEVLSDIFSWAVILGAAGLGTALNYIGPIIASQLLTNMAVSDKKAVSKMRDKLIAEWGKEILEPPAPPAARQKGKG